MKRLCKCGAVAIWYYAPYSVNKVESESYYCDNCVARGCTCNIDPITFEEDLDVKQRRFPCVDYDYSETGFLT